MLVVDDSPGIRTASKMILETFGFAVQTAGSVEEALKLVDTAPTPFALIITDLDMPKQSGHALIEGLRQRRSKSKTILISGKLDQEYIRQFKELGVNGFLKKPFTQDKVVRVIHSVIGSA